MIIELVLVVIAFNWPRFKFLSGAVAQLGERLICIQEVAGSIPTSSTTLKQLRCLTRTDAAVVLSCGGRSSRVDRLGQSGF